MEEGTRGQRGRKKVREQESHYWHFIYHSEPTRGRAVEDMCRYSCKQVWEGPKVTLEYKQH